MSYEESEIKCDYCGKGIDNGADVACRPCYEELEELVADLEKEVESLKGQLGEAGLL